MSLVGFIDGSQHRFVDSEAHGGSHQGQGQVSNNTTTINNEDDDDVIMVLDDDDDLPDEGDVSDRQETDENRSTDDAGVPGVLPVQQGVHLVRTEPHLG